MKSPFDEADADELIAPNDVFSGGWDSLQDGAFVTWNHAVRTSLALEIAHQLAEEIPGLVLKGGTALQSRLRWPPQRASVDIDLEWNHPHEVTEALNAFADRLVKTPVSVDEPIETPFSRVTHVRFPTEEGDETRIRLDITPPGTSTALSEPWRNPPTPWEDATTLQVPRLEAHAAQKLLLAAPPDFGRDLEDHRGRQNLIKDIFDLHSLSEQDLDSNAIQNVARLEVETKTSYLEGDWSQDRIQEGAVEAYRRFAHPRHDCPEEIETLWRAYLRVRPAIRAPFTDGDLRTAAGCAYHAVTTIFDDRFDWEDSWRPATAKTRRRAWEDQGPIQPVLQVADGFGEAKGLREAWAMTRES